jgi:hypothetical protein
LSFGSFVGVVRGLAFRPASGPLDLVHSLILLLARGRFHLTLGPLVFMYNSQRKLLLLFLYVFLFLAIPRQIRELWLVVGVARRRVSVTS